MAAGLGGGARSKELTQNLSDDSGSLLAGGIWKGENETDAELMGTYESPLA